MVVRDKEAMVIAGFRSGARNFADEMDRRFLNK